jgi:hypothetical protein
VHLLQLVFEELGIAEGFEIPLVSNRIKSHGVQVTLLYQIPHRSEVLHGNTP